MNVTSGDVRDDTSYNNVFEENQREENQERGGRQTKKPFVHPSLADIQSYCLERKNGIDPQRFIDFYQSNGWRVGRNPMRDWRAAVRTWERREKEGVLEQRRPGTSGRKVQAELGKYDELPVTVIDNSPR
jgi:hypothetical protein